MVKDTRKTPGTRLAKVHEASKTPAPVPAVDGEQVEHEPMPVTDEFRDHLHIVARLDAGYALSDAETKIMQARGLKGMARRSKIAEAIYALRVADAQSVVTAVAMAIVLPAWLGVMLRCGGLV